MAKQWLSGDSIQMRYLLFRRNRASVCASSRSAKVLRSQNHYSGSAVSGHRPQHQRQAIPGSPKRQLRKGPCAAQTLRRQRLRQQVRREFVSESPRRYPICHYAIAGLYSADDYLSTSTRLGFRKAAVTKKPSAGIER